MVGMDPDIVRPLENDMCRDGCALSECAHDSIQASPLRIGTCAFLRLPPELRNLIYYYCLGGTTWLIGARSRNELSDNRVSSSLALLHVCRQIHSEAALFPYMFNTFHGKHDGHLIDWVEKLQPHQRLAVRSIKSVQRGYIVETEEGLEVSPSFWMRIPDAKAWGLHALKQIELDVVLFSWRYDVEEKKVDDARRRTVMQIRELIESRNPDVRLLITISRNEYWPRVITLS